MKPRHRVRRALRFAGQVAACAIAGAALGVANAAAPLQVQGPVLLEADEVTYNSNTGIVTAAGNVEISDQMRVLRADAVTFNQATDLIGATGHVTLIEPDGTVAMAESIELTGDLREGALQGFYALIGEHGRLGAVSGTRREGRFTQAIGAVFTPCEICQEKGETTPLWQVKAARVTHDQVEKELTFEDARFEFFGVPILYLPVFTQPDPTVKHKSGLLYPVVGTSTYLGTFVQVPYHLSFSPSRDATVQPFITTSAGDVLLGEYRERWEHGGFWLQGSVGYDDAAGTNDSHWLSHLFGAGRRPLTDVWRAGFDAQLTSNDTYLRRYDISQLDRLTSDVFVDGVMGRSRGAVTSYYFQGLRAGDRQGLTPLVLPLAEYTYIPEHKIYGGRLQVDSSALVLFRTEGDDVVRGSASADWERQLISTNGQIYKAEVFGRSDIYHVNTEPVTPLTDGDEQTIGRGLGYLALEWRWPFARRIDFQNAILIVEPIAQLVAATGGGNPPGIPNEDSTTFEFDETNLFSPNEFPGLDLWTGGPRSNLGVRATALFSGGSIEAFLGQEFRTRRDPNFAPDSGVGDERSDIVGRIKVQFPGHIDLVHRFRIDPVNSTLRRNEVYLTANFRHSTLDLAYLKLEPETTDPSLQPREQIVISTTLGVYGNWAVFGRLRQDLARRNTLESEAGVRYEDECFMAQLGFSNRQTSDRDLRPTSALILKVGLKTGLTSPSAP